MSFSGSSGSGAVGGSIGASSTGGTMSVLREFVMRLGYTEDEQSRRKFTDAIKLMTVQVVALGAAVAAAAIGVLNGVRQIANSMNEVYFISERTKASASQIMAAGSAFEHFGSTVGEARAALEGIAEAVRENPGIQQYIESITGGKQYTDAATAMRDLSSAWQEMLQRGTNIAVIFQQAQQLHLTNAQVLTMLHGDFNKIVDEYLEIQHKVLGDEATVQRMAVNAKEFKQSYDALLSAINDFAIGFGDDMDTRLKPKIDEFKEYLLEHAADINAFMATAADVIVAVMHGVFDFAMAAGRAVESVTKWYQQLTPHQKEVVEALTKITAAIWLMNTALAASPLVRLGLLAAGIWELYQNYLAWKNDPTTETFIDWNKWGPPFEKAIDALKTVGGWIDSLVTNTVGWNNALIAVLAYMGATWVGGMIASFVRLIAGVDTAVLGSAGFGLLARVLPYLSLFLLSGDTPGGDDMGREAARKQGGAAWEDWQRQHPNPLTWAARKLGLMPTADEEKYQEGVDQLMKLGRSREAAAGIMANFAKENPSLDPSLVNSTGHGGLAQWSIERQRRFPEFLRAKGRLVNHNLLMATRQEQIEFYDWEAKTYEQEANALLNAAQTPEQGALGAMASERPEGWQGPAFPGPLYDERASIARGLYDRGMGTTATPTKPPTSATAPPGIDVPAILQPQSFVPFQGFSGSGDVHTTLNQTNNITVHGGGPIEDPDYMAGLIGQHVQNKTGQVLRNGTANVR